MNVLTQSTSDPQRIEQLTQRNHLLSQRVHQDGLTRMYNRNLLWERLRLEIELSKRTDLPLSVLVIDVDHFHDYNERHGHSAGDEVLKQIARVLRTQSRLSETMTVARYGGDEFIALIPYLQNVIPIAQRMKTKISELVFETGEQVTVSIGIATYPEQGSTPEALIATADAAMYRSKAAGRNQVSLAKTDSSLEPRLGG